MNTSPDDLDELLKKFKTKEQLEQENPPAPTSKNSDEIALLADDVSVKINAPQENALERVSHNRPKLQYQGKNARVFQNIFDELIAKPREVIIPYNRLGLKPNTMFIKVRQALRFLAEHDKKYQVLIDMFQVCRTATGLLFKVKQRTALKEDLIELNGPEMDLLYVNEEGKNTTKDQFMQSVLQYLSGDSKEEFIDLNIPEGMELGWIERICMGVAEFVVNMETGKVTIMKIQ